MLLRSIGKSASIKRIQDALGTAETGEALIEVALNAHKAEQELASVIKRMNLSNKDEA